MRVALLTIVGLLVPLIAGWSPSRRRLAEAMPAQELSRPECRDGLSVVEAEVSSLSSFSAGPHGQPGIHTRVQLTSVERWCGEAANEEQSALWYAGGELDGMLRVFSGHPAFSSGERVVVVLRSDAEGVWWPAGAEGKYVLDGEIYRGNGLVFRRDALKDFLGAHR